MSSPASKSFRVEGWVDRLGGWIEAHQGLCLRIAGAETGYLRDRLDRLAVDRPIYISALARAGTTILLEAVSRHPAVATHQYRDFPPVLTPYLWSWLLRYIETRPVAPAERPHGDRIMITPHSPEAMEEVVWKAFFPRAHDPAVSAVLDGAAANPEFEAFYRAHVGKLLLARGGSRYAAKGNYNVTRLEYIQKIFPDARFIVPVRRPESHIASLQRQHRRFTEGLRDNPRAVAHLRRVGHFEFGPERRPIHAGDAAAVREIQALWARGEELRGWARYWALVYRFLADRLDRNERLRAATLVLRFEDLCRSPAARLARLFDHAGLADAGAIVDDFAPRLSAPQGYGPGYSASELAVIREETEATAARFGYGRVPALA